ncbi:uncharacterized protein [Amphiura filiformis]|uniref:uncharacterized protein n=1 Tax=Amphiura filiformis TaxID=82378 RepID=UPI003B218474
MPMMLSRLRCLKSGNTLCLGNVHLSFLTYKRLDVTALEAALAIRHVSKQSEDGPHLLCGDFNQEPFMPGYQMLHNGHLADTDKELLRQFPLGPDQDGLKENYLVDLIPELFSHKSEHLKSAYKTIAGHEVPFSNHEDVNGTMKFPSMDDIRQQQELPSVSRDTPEDEPCHKKKKLRRLYQTKPENYGKEVFIAALDYLWYGADELSCTGVLEMIDESKIEQFHSAPNIVFPSDHLLMKAEFEFASSS